MSIHSARRARPVLAALLLTAFAIASPALGGAFRCCAVAGHDGADPHATTSSVAETPEHHPGSHEHHVVESPPDEDAPEPTAPCTCVGPCHPIVAPMPSAAPIAHDLAPVREVASKRPDSGAPRRDRRSARTLPFANGPPSPPIDQSPS